VAADGDFGRHHQLPLGRGISDGGVSGSEGKRDRVIWYLWVVVVIDVLILVYVLWSDH